MGDVVPPAAKLRVEVVEVAKGPGRKERVPEVLDLALDFPLLIAAGRRTGPGHKVRVPRELEQAGMKLNRRAPPIKHSAAEIVVDQGPGTPAQRLEGGDVSAEEALERLVQREEREEGARVAEDHHEAGDRAHAVADADRAKRTPVDLCVLAHQGDHAAIDVRGRLGPQAPHQSADLYGRPGVAPEAEHLVEPRGAQAGILREGVADERQKRVEGTRPTRPPAEAARLVLQRRAHRRMVDPEGGGDGPDLPVFAEIEAPDLSTRLTSLRCASESGMCSKTSKLIKMSNVAAG